MAAGGFQRRYQPLDVSVCVVRGTDGLLVVDTRSSHREADEIRADLRELGPIPVRWVVNTHAHYDHTFGNARFGPASDLDAPICGHERVPAGHRWPPFPGHGMAAAVRDGYRQLAGGGGVGRLRSGG